MSDAIRHAVSKWREWARDEHDDELRRAYLELADEWERRADREDAQLREKEEPS